MTRLRALGAVLVVLVVLAVGGAATTVQYNQLNGPEQAVLDYASLLADGRASDAGKRVTPAAGKGERLDLSLLTDAVLARASSRIRPLSAAVESGKAGGADVAVGGATTVDLTYALGRQSAVARLTVQRVADGFPFAHRWRVTTPLLVPVLVQSTLPQLGAPSIAGVDLPMTGTSLQDGVAAPAPVLVYPGIYPLTTAELPYLSTDVGDAPASLVALHAADASVQRTVTASLTWSASSALTQKLTSEVVQPFTQCVAEGRQMRPTCPGALYALRGRPGLTSDLLPAAPVLGSVSIDPATGDAVTGFTFAEPARVRWTNGPATGAQVQVSGTVLFPVRSSGTPTLTFGR